jgi:hypothetical protein
MVGLRVTVGLYGRKGNSRVEFEDFADVGDAELLPVEVGGMADCPADHRRRATGIAPERSSGIEREARGLSECRGDETRSSPATNIREGRFGWLFVF